MKVDIEETVCTIRAWHDTSKGYGDPFDLVATVIRFGKAAHIVGMHGALTITGYREICRQLKLRGITHLTWEHNGLTRGRQL